VTEINSARRALCRAIPATFDHAIVQGLRPEPIRTDHAREQHRAYAQALAALGLEVTVLPLAPEFPDSCFVEDCAVYADGVALITRPGAPSRQGEERSVAEALRPFVRLETTNPPATLEGGDCLRLGKRWYVGRSRRTNLAGMERLRQVYEPLGFEVIEIPLAGILHLKCVCSSLGERSMLLAEGTIPTQVFRDVRVIVVPAAEQYAANCLCVNDTVLLPAGFPATRRLVEEAGYRVRELDTSEIRKADGSMTCMSILL
jgi:dimethylargininase